MNKKINKFIAFSIVFYLNGLLHCKQPITLFCHGIIDNKNQINRYENFMKLPAISFDFPDAQQPDNWDVNTLIFQSTSLFGKRVNRNKMFMGTDQDITTLKNHINPEESYILYGFSRGGSAAINYLAQYNPHNIQALILEATPADMIDAVEKFQYNLGYKFADNRSTQEILFHALFPAYQLESTPPVENITNIANKNLPIFIVHAHDDTRVPVDAAYKLYLAFQQAGFMHIYLCQLNTGKHAHYTTGSEKDLYLRALHSFYKKYKFNYDLEFATIDDLTSLQPTRNEIIEKLQLHQKQLESKYVAQKKFNQTAIQITAGLIALNFGWYKMSNDKKFSSTKISKNIAKKIQ